MMNTLRTLSSKIEEALASSPGRGYPVFKI